MELKTTMSPTDCPWDVYDVGSRSILGVGLYLTGIASVTFSGLLLITLLKSSLLHDRSCLTLLNLCAACFARSVVGFLFTGSSALSNRWLFGSSSCTLIGFLHQFTGVYQMESITHMCIERYVKAKYIMNGWEMTKSRYAIFIGLCWFFSCLYSIPPLYGISEYSWDYSCTACTVSMVLPAETWRRYVFITILMMQSIKPVIVISFMVYWAREVEKHVYNEKEHLNSLLFTQSAIKVTWSTLLCWAPTFLVTVWVVVTQMTYGIVVPPPTSLAVLASLGSEIAPAVTVLVIIGSNENVRQAIITLCGDSTHNKIS